MAKPGIRSSTRRSKTSITRRPTPVRAIHPLERLRQEQHRQIHWDHGGGPARGQCHDRTEQRDLRQFIAIALVVLVCFMLGSISSPPIKVVFRNSTSAFIIVSSGAVYFASRVLRPTRWQPREIRTARYPERRSRAA
jgi:hypothetical protein